MSLARRSISMVTAESSRGRGSRGEVCDELVQRLAPGYRPPRWPGIVACQIGTAFAARTDRASLRRTGLTSNPLLLAAIAIEVVLAATLICLPFLHPVFGTTSPTAGQLLIVAPFPFIVWGADEIDEASNAADTRPQSCPACRRARGHQPLRS